MKYNYNINSSTEFKDSIEIESLDKEIAVFLNDYNSEQISNFLAKVGEKLGQINKTQMEQLGLKEEENPLLYSNPITALGFMIFNAASETIESIDLSEMQLQQFNDIFVKFEGEQVSSADVMALIRTVSNRNLSTELEGEENTFVTLTLDGNQISDSANIETGKLYVVEAIYNDEGRVSEMKIITKN